MDKFTTRNDAVAEIVNAIEAGDASRDEFDIEAITDEVIDFDTDLQAYVYTVDTEGFWAAVMGHTL